jgi:probable HAF family extracellular repeat protein
VNERRLPLVVAVLVLVVALQGTTAAAQTFTVVDLGTLGGTSSRATAVSNGQVVGVSNTSGGAEHAFSWTQGGGMVDLGTLSGTSSRASAISNGQVVGNATTSAGPLHAFSWTQAAGMVDLGTLGRRFSDATAVSDGQVVGSTRGGGVTRGFSWTQARGMVNLALPDWIASQATGVSNGQVVGSATISGGAVHAMLWMPTANDCCQCPTSCAAPVNGTCADGCPLVLDATCKSGDLCVFNTPTATPTITSTPTITPTPTPTAPNTPGANDCCQCADFCAAPIVGVGTCGGCNVVFGASCGDGGLCVPRTPTPTPTNSPTVTPTPKVCVGDCNTDQQVTVDDVLTMVNVALGNTGVATCQAGDANRLLKKSLSTLRQAQGERKNAMKSGRGSAHAELVEAWGGVFQRAANHDGQITVDEILTAVNNALNGCSK